MKYYFFLLLFVCISPLTEAQKNTTNSGKISFFSEAPLENIEASNNPVYCAYDSSTGFIFFQVRMRKFEFEKTLMQKHFNENYVESDIYPYARFEGQVINHEEINHSKNGKYKAVVMGKLTIHGKTQTVKETGIFEIKGSHIKASTKFNILVKDYDIKIPRAVIKNIAEEVEVHVNITLKPFTENS
jgi:hypothetical protein